MHTYPIRINYSTSCLYRLRATHVNVIQHKLENGQLVRLVREIKCRLPWGTPYECLEELPEAHADVDGGDDEEKRGCRKQESSTRREGVICEHVRMGGTGIAYMENVPVERFFRRMRTAVANTRMLPEAESEINNHGK